MSEEEKQAIEYIKKQKREIPPNGKFMVRKKDIQTILNLIGNQQKQIQDLKQINEEHRKLNGELREEINKLKKEKEDILDFWEE